MLAGDEKVLDRKCVGKSLDGYSIFYIKTKRGETYTHSLGCPKKKKTYEILRHEEDENLSAKQLKMDVEVFQEILGAK